MTAQSKLQSRLAGIRTRTDKACSWRSDDFGHDCQVNLSKQAKREYNLKRANAALERRNKNLIVENKKLLGIIRMQKAQLRVAEDDAAYEFAMKGEDWGDS